MLCYKAAAHYLKPCVPTLVELIRRFALTPHPVLKPVLTALVSNALSATPSSNYYMKVTNSKKINSVFNLLIL